MKSFDYIRPATLDETSPYLTSEKQVSLLGGGTTLFLDIQEGAVTPEVLLDVKAIANFHDVRYHHNHGLKLGAAVNLQHLATGLEIRRHYPLLHQTAQKLASPQIRNRATIGGTVAWAAPTSELAAPLLCYDAVCHIWSPRGNRTLPINELYLGDGKTALGPDEIITHLHLPSFPARTHGIYQRQTVRHDGRRMIAGMAALAIRKHNNLGNWRIAVLGVDDRPKRIPQAEVLLEGAPDENAIVQALAVVQENIHPQDVVYARSDYRRAALMGMLERSIRSIIKTLQES